MNNHSSDSTRSCLVSIIIPCYKAEKELPEALQSVSEQIHTEWELVVVNDGWEDSTEKIVTDFQAIHPKQKIKYIKHPKNRGLGATRNTAMAAATGDYIAFLDHDDLWEKNHLSIGVETLSTEGTDIYYSTVSVFDSTGKSDYWLWGPTSEDLLQFPNSIFARNFIQPSAAIITKLFLQRLGTMDTDPKLHLCEDHDFWIRAVILGGKFSYAPTVTSKYRYSNPNAQTAKTELMLKNDLHVQKKHLASSVFPKSVVRNAIANNYKRLSDYYWKKKHLNSLFCLCVSLYWKPTDTSSIRQLIKGLFYWPIIFEKLRS
ncbi:MAG: glycosyltransferase family 2 protein [Bdellovibrionales bacterium]|nr:glycosyltransferase family 2 protein [Bdellovibrionales bacterium]